MRCKLSLSLAVVLTGVHLEAQAIEFSLPDHPMSEYVKEFVTASLDAQGIDNTIEINADEPLSRHEGLVKRGQDGYATFALSGAGWGSSVEIPVYLTDGLLGKRVFFIREGEQDRFASIESLEDLQNSGLVGGLGAEWADVDIWNHNGLEVNPVSGDWSRIYTMLEAGSRNVDYFSRGIMEIAVESKRYPQLGIEGSFIAKYDADLTLHVSPAMGDDIAVLQSAMESAVESGLQETLLRKHFSEVFDPNGLNLDGRRIINLQIPKFPR